jgi:hypothetical protein
LTHHDGLLDEALHIAPDQPLLGRPLRIGSEWRPTRWPCDR